MGKDKQKKVEAEQPEQQVAASTFSQLQSGILMLIEKYKGTPVELELKEQLKNIK